MDHSGHMGHMDHSTDSSMTGEHPMMMSMMQMTFNFSTDCTLLFEWWHPRNILGMLVSCAIIFAMAAMLEALRAFRDALYMKTRQTGSSSSLISSGNTSWTSSMFSPTHVVQTVLYALQVIIGYILMLLFMTFNGYVCIAIVLGATVGFFGFGWKKSMMLEMTSDHCG